VVAAEHLDISIYPLVLVLVINVLLTPNDVGLLGFASNDVVDFIV